MSAARIAELQRALLAIIKGGSSFNTWAEVNGMPLNERTSLRQSISKGIRVRELRLEIHALDPDAALYFNWHGGHEAEREFRGIVARAAACEARA